ncbi:alpha-2-macroglobulin family protein [Hufsiella ginkgonis]|uniref:Alpha-2-macroglobulin n=1 Tax=Hufsiella ginkgonis TaxID=2695274 RepID=A0A7K1XZK7_9SPHI|nr:MG2 domain-containing protein [Hufsiella ginkgonis]MXV16247.1 hypothetical protein [Hufsiella ginkgonis]
MKNPGTRYSYTKVVFLLLLALTLPACRYFQKDLKPDSAYSQFLEAYTSGTISKKSPIRVQFASSVTLVHPQNGEAPEVFSFSPSIKGKTVWVTDRTLEFRPDEDLDPDKRYDATIELAKITEVPEELKTFAFDFKVMKPGVEFKEDGLKAINSSSLDYMKLTGSLSFADTEDPRKIEKVLTSSYSGGKMKIKWAHDPETRVSSYTIDSIPRKKTAEPISLSWDGDPIDAEAKGSTSLEVPAVGADFKVLDIKAVQDTDQYVLVQFSDPVLVAQDLNGLIGIANVTDLRYTIEGSEVKVYAPDQLNGNYSVTVNEGIENIRALKTGKGMSANVNFESHLPSVSIPGKGIILPGAGKLTFPFEASNLSAVDVTIIKIYENNIPQYLQRNTIDGEQELRRVARPVVEKTVRLDADKNLNLRKKNRFSLDIDKLLRTEPGAIYRITIGFRKAYALQVCNGSKPAPAEDSNEYEYDGDGYYSDSGSDIDEDDDFWSRYGSFYPDNYSWADKDDPCTESYYTGRRWASRNVIASNIGLIAKEGASNSLVIAATDILTTKPMSGVELRLLDYQNQVLQTITTDGEGLAQLSLKRKPFLLVAQKGAERGYLKLDDGSSLPLGRFNVNGDIVQKGLKGFIYGERGVWRPGDSLFLSFVLEDKDKKMPADMPVTFELYNPQGQLTRQMIKSNPVNGFYSFHTATESTAPTGNWSARIKAGGALFQKTLKIETVMPNRLKINFDLGGRSYLTKDGPGKASLSAKWLFGATAQNLKAKVDVTLKPGKTSFPGFSGYVFDDPTGTFEPETKTIFDGGLSPAGTADIETGISAATTAPGVLTASFNTRVFEPGGGFSIDNFSIPYHMYDAYAGIRFPKGVGFSEMLYTDRDNNVSIVSVSPEGKPVAGKREVQVELYKIQWRWWWDQQQENLGNFTQDRYNKLISVQKLTLNNGAGRWNLRVNSPEWGRYLVRVKDLTSGHVTGQTVYMDWPGGAKRELEGSQTDAAMLSFTADKQSYKAGEEVTLTIPSSAGGRGLVSIETGSKVLKTWWIETEKGQTIYKFKAKKEMAPNVYVNVTLLQPHSQTANDLPIRMYGVIPLLVSDPQTVLKPVISMADVLRPETTSTVTISESGGRPMTYTIALVDEGLLDLTRFKTPDPHSAFYAREALGVKTWDLFDHVIGAWGGDLERILSIGGDGMNRNVDPAKSNRFKPVVKFLGPFHLEPGEKRIHQVKLPQYVGSVRMMVVAGENGAYGSAEKTIQVKKPLMLLTTLPRVAGPGESFKVPVTLFAMENRIRRVNVRVLVNGLLSGAKDYVVDFEKPGEKMIDADIAVKNLTGVGKITVIATSGTERTQVETELVIRNPNPFITSVVSAELDGGKKWTGAVSPLANGSTSIELSAIPVNVGKRLDYLIQYPHGCIEQTTSSVFPQLLLDNVTDLSGQQKATIERNVRAGISRIRGFQTADGGLAYWPGERDADEWGTNYAGHFMLEAQAKGYSLPAGFMEPWKNYQRGKAVQWAPNTNNFYGGDLMQSYRLYLLALAKSPEIGAMNRLKEFAYLSPAAKWQLAAAYKLIGQAEVANALVRGLDYHVKPYKQMGYTYGSDMRDEAIILETLTYLGKRAEANKLLVSIGARLATDNWYSTQTTAYALIAIAKYCGIASPGKRIQATYTLNGKVQSVSTGSFVYRAPLVLKGGKNTIAASNQLNAKLFVKVISEGRPPAGTILPSVRKPAILVMNVAYKTQSGARIDPAALRQGTDFVAEVTVRNPGNRSVYEQMALTQIFPSGWEIINTRLAENDETLKLSPYTYRDIRDDRVLTYFNIQPAQTLTYQVLLTAAYAGRYFLPPTSCEAMYDNDIQAVAAGKWVIVTK